MRGIDFIKQEMLPNYYIRGGGDIEKTNTAGWTCYNADGCRDIYRKSNYLPFYPPTQSGRVDFLKKEKL